MGGLYDAATLHALCLPPCGMLVMLEHGESKKETSFSYASGLAAELFFCGSMVLAPIGARARPENTGASGCNVPNIPSPVIHNEGHVWVFFFLAN